MPPAPVTMNMPGVRILKALSSDPGLLLVTAVIILAVYGLDAVTPLGQPVWLLYLIPLALSFWSERYYALPTVFTVTLFFLIGGFYVSPAGAPPQTAIVNRFTFMVVFFALALVLWVIRGRQIREENL